MSRQRDIDFLSTDGAENVGIDVSRHAEFDFDGPGVEGSQKRIVFNDFMILGKKRLKNKCLN